MFEKVYVVRGEIPSKKNNPIITRSRIRLPSRNYQMWERAAVASVAIAGRPAAPIDSARIHLCIYHGDLIRRDGDNELTSVQDMLMKARVIKDDNWMRIGTPTVDHFLDPRNPRVEISVCEVEPIDWKSRMKELKKDERKHA